MVAGATKKAWAGNGLVSEDHAAGQAFLLVRPHPHRASSTQTPELAHIWNSGSSHVPM
jgi:hypothetical protein